MIDVIEGTTVNLNIVGNRVAFSIYGNVNSLNGDGKIMFSVSQSIIGMLTDRPIDRSTLTNRS